MYRLFIKDGGLEELDYSSLQHVTTAGEPLNDEVYENHLDKQKL